MGLRSSWVKYLAVLSLSAVIQCGDCFIVPQLAAFGGVFSRPASRPGLLRKSQCSHSLVGRNRVVGARLRAPMQVVTMQNEEKDVEGEKIVVLEPEW